MARQLLHFFATAPSRTGSPNNSTLYWKELEVLAAKSLIALASGGSSRLY